MTDERAILTDLIAELRYGRWDPSVPPGGLVCVACGVPVESEPCPEHGGNLRAAADRAEARLREARP